MSSKTSVTCSVGFVDMATFCELEAYMYGGLAAITLFVRSVLKANWFTFVPVSLRHVSGTPAFDSEFSASVNRSGDYVLNIWLRIKLPKVKYNGSDTSVGIRWTHNFMHNLVKKCEITFNELSIHDFDSAWFDMNHYFRTPASKRVGYDTMIGEISDMVDFVTANGNLGTGGYFNLPLPLFFAEDSGIALPIAALPFNEVKINYTFRHWKDLMVVDPGASGLTRDAILNSVVDISTSAEVKFSSVETRAHYAVIHNDERVLMGKAPRDILMHQIQNLQEQSFDATAAQVTYDLRFSHAIHFMGFAARNTTISGEWSNYAVLDSSLAGAVDLNGVDPIAQAAIIYENTPRVDEGSDYYSTVAPWYFCPAIPDVSGIHGYAHSLNAFGLDPQGSTNYSKLANVSITLTPSAGALSDATNKPAIGTIVASNVTRSYKFQLRVRNWNIVRLSGGSLGLPVL